MSGLPRLETHSIVWNVKHKIKLTVVDRSRKIRKLNNSGKCVRVEDAGFVVVDFSSMIEY
jgi:hypothetical protein